MTTSKKIADAQKAIGKAWDEVTALAGLELQAGKLQAIVDVLEADPNDDTDKVFPKGRHAAEVNGRLHEFFFGTDPEKLLAQELLGGDWQKKLREITNDDGERAKAAVKARELLDRVTADMATRAAAVDKAATDAQAKTGKL